MSSKYDEKTLGMIMVLNAIGLQILSSILMEKLCLSLSKDSCNEVLKNHRQFQISQIKQPIH